MLQASPHRDVEDRAATRPDASPRHQPVTAWLLDTNVLSELRRPRPEPKAAVTFVATQKLDLLFVSDVTSRRDPLRYRAGPPMR